MADDQPIACENASEVSMPDDLLQRQNNDNLTHESFDLRSQVSFLLYLQYFKFRDLSIKR